MAFDLYIKDERASIEHYEEGMFDLTARDESFPQLNLIFQRFYDDPRIEPHQSNDLVHELIALRSEVVSENDYKYIVQVIDRLLPFFSKAYKTGQAINCSSD
ncbi:hypothetical protein ACFOD0_02645 [Shewanella intestini]|uniref:Uncharacterized protein n=1 Tax=Shewanella intestini TaxID=2017544 RepID=A0ABS5I142_9GAMM|nr:MULTISPECIES: hypothetical protein [Shewanella]MBR9727744.1 hypothetical protein [Shewanella intestini]MRG36263.1 hypothetical protein [Shewanella sp. XMDDZSB0408]